MSSPSPRLLHAVLAIALTSVYSVLLAQEPADLATPPHVHYVDGAATLERDGQLDPVTANMPVVEGDRLHTSSGRVEILLSDGSAIDLDQDSTLDVLSPELFRLTMGRVMVTVAGASDPSRASRYQVDTPTAAVQTDGPGEFRISVLQSDQTELAVMRGYAVFSNERGSVNVGAGERSVAFDENEPSRTQVFNSARFDPFDRWIAERRDARISVSSSSRYLPRELQVYGGELERSGSWQYNGSYGYVWYPTVTSDWRPYYTGYWSSVPSYGWTWIGADGWSWPTHHFGRWGHAGGSWFWIPGRAFGPAWVTWASAADYVSWCPLGFDGRPVFSFSVFDSWQGWTVMPRSSFGFHESRVNRYAITAAQLPRGTPFIAHSAPPASSTRAVVRPGGAFDPRSSSRRRDDSTAAGRDAGSRGPGTPGGRGIGAPGADDSARRREVGDLSRTRGAAGPGISGGDATARRRVEEGRDPTPRLLASPERGYRQPLPDSYRRTPPQDGPPRPSIGPRPETPRFETATPRERQQPATPTLNGQIEAARRRVDPQPGPYVPGVIYHRGPEQPPPTTAPVMRRTPEADNPAGPPSFRRNPDAAPPPRPVPPAVVPPPRTVPPPPAAPPRSVPPPTAAPEASGGRDSGGSIGGDRAVPRNESGGGGGNRRR